MLRRAYFRLHTRIKAWPDPRRSGGFGHPREVGAIAFSDRYRHRRAVYEPDQEFRGIQLKILDDTIFNSMGQL
jgi:hypothetical protein